MKIETKSIRIMTYMKDGVITEINVGDIVYLGYDKHHYIAKVGKIYPRCFVAEIADYCDFEISEEWSRNALENKLFTYDLIVNMHLIK
jgi:hypothetical protein